MIKGHFEYLGRLVGFFVAHADPFLGSVVTRRLRALRITRSPSKPIGNNCGWLCGRLLIMCTGYSLLRNGCSKPCCPAVCARA